MVRIYHPWTSSLTGRLQSRSQEVQISRIRAKNGIQGLGLKGHLSRKVIHITIRHLACSLDRHGSPPLGLSRRSDQHLRPRWDEEYHGYRLSSAMYFFLLSIIGILRKAAYYPSDTPWTSFVNAKFSKGKRPWNI